MYTGSWRAPKIPLPTSKRISVPGHGNFLTTDRDGSNIRSCPTGAHSDGQRGAALGMY
ncbi:hypothetical protein DPMN_017833 [Dreissena polymorpha]|uniref:Uncharacterized protein n=1 Tax=Dreissena polymorpha TaxID=45954 RepID=A0A9D4S7U4_DREPO|nr:hypothetical protein DPMN_017833 [Dreissena polymorpha]